MKTRLTIVAILFIFAVVCGTCGILEASGPPSCEIRGSGTVTRIFTQDGYFHVVFADSNYIPKITAHGLITHPGRTPHGLAKKIFGGKSGPERELYGHARIDVWLAQPARGIVEHAKKYGDDIDIRLP